MTTPAEIGVSIAVGLLLGGLISYNKTAQKVAGLTTALFFGYCFTMFVIEQLK